MSDAEDANDAAALVTATFRNPFLISERFTLQYSRQAFTRSAQHRRKKTRISVPRSQKMLVGTVSAIGAVGVGGAMIAAAELPSAIAASLRPEQLAPF